MMKYYGKELILDIHNCNVSLFTRLDIEQYLKELCDLIDMQREDLHFWDYEDEPEELAKAPPHLKGISVVQFIKTSTIVIHTLTEMKRVYINIFSCKNFNTYKTKTFTKNWFGGKIIQWRVMDRL